MPIPIDVTYREHAPPASLRAHVDCLWTSGDDGTVPRLVLPDGAIDIVLAIDRGGRVSASAVGTMTTALTVPAAAIDRIGIRFRPGGAVPLLRLTASELTDRTVPLDDVLGARRSRVSGVSEPGHRVQAVLRWLLEQMRGVPAPDHVATVLQHAFAASTVEQLAEVSGYHPRQLQRRFLATVGIGPKLWLRVQRLQRAVAALQFARRTLADVAADCGYFDEAHMHRDFKLLAGRRVSDFSKRPPVDIE